MRQCGDCQLCCKLLPVRSLQKGANTKCQHQRAGKGCTVYAKLWSVSPECKLWNCRWLGNDDMDDLKRPDRVHYVVDIMPDFVTARDKDSQQPVKLEVAQIWCDPKHPNAHRDPALRAWLERKHLIGLVRYGNEDAITIIPPKMMANGEWFEKRAGLGVTQHTAAELVETFGWRAMGGQP